MCLRRIEHRRRVHPTSVRENDRKPSHTLLASIGFRNSASAPAHHTMVVLRLFLAESLGHAMYIAAAFVSQASAVIAYFFNNWICIHKSNLSTHSEGSSINSSGEQITGVER